MPTYRIRLINSALELDRTIEVPDSEYILDIAEEQGIRLPAGCRQGDCSACVVKLTSGEIDQSEQKFLQPHELAAGYRIICVGYPMSDCSLETHQEQVLYPSSSYYSNEPGH
jgi:ferredoxin